MGIALLRFGTLKRWRYIGMANENEFGCRPKLIALIPPDATLDGCSGCNPPNSLSPPPGGGGGGSGGGGPGDGVITTGGGKCDSGGNGGDGGPECPEAGKPMPPNKGVICVDGISGGGGGTTGPTCAGCLCGYTPSIGNKTLQISLPSAGPMAPGNVPKRSQQSNEGMAVAALSSSIPMVC